MARSPAQTNAASEASKPFASAFHVNRYEVSGSAALDTEEVNHIMNEAIGASVSFLQIHRSLLKLQQAYRDRGYTNAAVHLPRQPLTNGLVRVKVNEGSSVSSTRSLPVWQVPHFDIQHFEIYGNTVLEPEAIDRILSPAAGEKVSSEQLKRALETLRSAYRQRGYALAEVKIPEQILSGANVIIKITEGSSTNANPNVLASANAQTNPVVAPTERTFEVRRYEVIGNTLLKPETIGLIFSNATGSAVSLKRIQSTLGELQLAYRERGFATVSVGLPQQQLTNAVVKVQVTEGRLVDARVTGNRYFSSNNVMRALPSVRDSLVWQDQVINSRVLQRELDIANQNRDRQIYPAIVPGPEPGTSALNLKVKDRLPLHGRLEVNNYSTPGTPDWRVNGSINYANLGQLEHQIGLSYGFTPEKFKSDGLVRDYLLNRPLVANYGAYYRIPFGEAESVQERINSSAIFGYDEATHQFRLPPAGSRPDLTFYVSGSSSDTGIQRGPTIGVVTNNPLISVSSQDSGQNLSINENLGARLNLPLVVSDAVRWNFSLGVDWKRYELRSFNTNTFFYTIVVTNDSEGTQVINDSLASGQPAFRQEVGYLPLSIGADFFQTSPRGSTSVSLGLSGNFIGGNQNFATLAYSSRAKAQYAKATFAVTRDQKVFKNWSLLMRGNGQAATGPLLSNEQFALGGLGSVRGYFEGDDYGDAGWFASVELRTPYITGTVAGWDGDWPVWLRGSFFVDGGQRFLLERIPGETTTRSLCGAGFGLSANVNNRVDMRLAIGIPLRDSGNTRAGDPHAYFSVGGQF